LLFLRKVVSEKFFLFNNFCGMIFWLGVLWLLVVWLVEYGLVGVVGVVAIVCFWQLCLIWSLCVVLSGGLSCFGCGSGLLSVGEHFLLLSAALMVNYE
jgi:hypothetical protein